MIHIIIVFFAYFILACWWLSIALELSKFNNQVKKLKNDDELKEFLNECFEAGRKFGLSDKIQSMKGNPNFDKWYKEKFNA